MRVVSELADIEFQVGAISLNGDDLVIDSAPGSTLAARIMVSPRDARATLARIALSPSAWGFLLRLPFAPLRGKRQQAGERAWQERRRQTGLNKPW